MEKESLEKKVDKITVEVVKHTEVIKNLVTRDEFNEKMGKVLESQDKMMVILQRLDQERIFTIERIRHLEEDVNPVRCLLSNGVNKIKAHLALS